MKQYANVLTQNVFKLVVQSMHERTQFLIIVLALFLIPNALMAQYSTAVNAHISVGCPFYASINTLPAYPLQGNIILNYTVKTQASCTIPNVSGNITIANGNGAVLKNRVSFLNISESPTKGNVLLATAGLPNTTYSAMISLNGQGSTNTSTSYFDLLNPTNIIITGISMDTKLSLGSQAAVTINVDNKGQYASTGSTLYLSVNGPATYSNSYNVQGLSPGQQENITITLSGITPDVGNYNLTAYIQYGFLNHTYNSKPASLAYGVFVQHTSGQGSSGGTVAPLAYPIKSIQNFVLISAPFIVSASNSNPAIAILQSVNNGTYSESINLSTTKAYSGIVKLSPQLSYLLPKQQLNAQIIITPNSSMSGTYAIPININVSTNSGSQTNTEYLLLNVYKPSKYNLQAINFISLSNAAQTADGVIEISNPSSHGVKNAVLQTLVPDTLVSNALQISTSGMYGTIHTYPGYYAIDWQVPELSANTSIFAYYFINKPSNVSTITNIQNVLVQPTPSNSSTIKIINTVIPILYTNSSATIQLNALYTGSVPEQVSFYLSAAQGLSIQTPYRTMDMVPNQLASLSFNISSSKNSGTYVLTVNTYSNTYNASYQIPIIVLPVETATTPPSQSASQSPQTISYVAALIAILIISIVVLFVRSRANRAIYSPGRAERLVRIREQIRRNNKEE